MKVLEIGKGVESKEKAIVKQKINCERKKNKSVENRNGIKKERRMEV
jgi:hypothetical protein